MPCTSPAKLVAIVFLYLVAILPSPPAYSAQSPAWDGRVLGFDPIITPGLVSGPIGLRKYLAEKGFNYKLNYLSESEGNLHGGYNSNKTISFIDQESFTFQQDLERYTGIPGAVIDGNIVNRNHNNLLTTRRLQDPRVPYNDLSQESWGGKASFRLGWLSFARTFDKGKFFWRIGLMNKAQDFDQIEGCDFQLLSLCGGKSSYTLTWSNFNVHYLATSLQYHLTPTLTLKGGVFESNPDAPKHYRDWSVSMRGVKGVLVPLELQWKSFVRGLPGIYDFGVIYNSANQADLSEGKTQKVGASDPQGYKTHGNTWYMYTGFNQQLTTFRGFRDRGLSMAYALGIGDDRNLYMPLSTSVAFRFRGLFDARPKDRIGIGVSYTRISNHLRQNQRNLNRINHVTDYDNPLYAPIFISSITGDFHYQFQVTSSLIIQPDIQYWHHPGGITRTPDAWSGGVKVTADF